MKIGIQGVKASFHDVAAKKFFGARSFEAVECNSFPLLFEKLDQKETDFAVMAIENALAGSILPNYALMEKYKVKIVGEVFLKIEMCLLALPGEKIQDLRVIQSHPMALLQCGEFLHSLPFVKLIEHADTAESAMEIKSRHLTHHGAIASALAAQTYGLEILQSNIETHKANFTRFLILARADHASRVTSANKASLRFEAEHTPGSLSQILSIFEKHSINMSQIHSLHILGRPFHFAFQVDLEWEDAARFDQALQELSAKVLSLTHFGQYLSGEKPQL
jgi:prephenate dehydratase